MVLNRLVHVLLRQLPQVIFKRRPRRDLMIYEVGQSSVTLGFFLVLAGVLFVLLREMLENACGTLPLSLRFTRWNFRDLIYVKSHVEMGW